MEAETRAVLRAFVAVGDLEHWIADQPWHATPSGWVVPEPFQTLRFQVEPMAGGSTSLCRRGGEPAAWLVPGR
jgi:hypothetical protein